MTGREQVLKMFSVLVLCFVLMSLDESHLLFLIKAGLQMPSGRTGSNQNHENQLIV